MSDISASGSLRGRALAQEKRRQQAMRKQGGGAAKPVAAPSAPKSGSSGEVAPVSASSVHPENMRVKSSGREAALAHRAMRCSGAQCWSDPEQRRPRRRGQRPSVAPVTTEAADFAAGQAPALVPGVEEEFIDSVCELVETRPSEFGWRERSVRQLCRARRQTLAQRGKAALTVVRGLTSAAARLRYLESGSTREFAKLRREEMSQHGRGFQKANGDAPGKRRSRKFRKVEEGTTLAGSVVTGTQVERNPAVTGNEAGSCRVITGTEYVGAEQFDRFCSTRPEAAAPKVAITRTSGRQVVSGTQVGRAPAVTGDEAGSCASVTGTEYLSSDGFQSFCNTALEARAPKVVTGRTQRQALPVTGSDESRASRVTGYEAGVNRSITGSQYWDAGVAKMTINGAPSKVAETHTFAGRSVSGTAVDPTQRITGLEAGECRQLTGTEYLSLESYQSICNSKPEPAPAKVGVVSTDRGQRVTGNLVDRSEKVTGNEPGSCLRVTGTGYSSPTLCGGGVDKVQEMTSLRGSTITGTGMDRLPKMSGDERGGCWPVTGTEYHGQQQYAHCASTPQPEAAKVIVSRTDRGQLVTGPAMHPADNVTGNEAGEDLPVTGTPFVGEEVVDSLPVQAQPAERASCSCDGCSYKQKVLAMEAAGTSQRFVPTAPAPVAAEEAPIPQSFSIVPPSRQMPRRITGNAIEQAGRITGPVNLARGLITGTPEFRSRGAEPMVAAPVAAAPQVAAPERGSWQITGDDWSRNERVTGTEGAWAQSRNPTQRGTVRSCVMSAVINKEQPLAAPIGDSKVTGSSGGAGQRGAAVTYSGGARG
ncbi:CsoS2 family carboxysome shell protein [Candidatus Igneacidithiobacillus taiwanensis]|uniref:CsoS2 family carboxysome shell protein n=1 Tax=Candidatus Igneacidithiobacillus taiwanensis TaxID=1945924 RepID=UPI00289F3442|nr:CsoS2 family carboxysome shell protein [Candidatus Igneacidithiobacillus taiwanensis]